MNKIVDENSSKLNTNELSSFKVTEYLAHPETMQLPQNWVLVQTDHVKNLQRPNFCCQHLQNHSASS